MLDLTLSKLLIKSEFGTRSGRTGSIDPGSLLNG